MTRKPLNLALSWLVLPVTIALLVTRLRPSPEEAWFEEVLTHAKNKLPPRSEGERQLAELLAKPTDGRVTVMRVYNSRTLNGRRFLTLAFRIQRGSDRASREDMCLVREVGSPTLTSAFHGDCSEKAMRRYLK